MCLCGGVGNRDRGVGAKDKGHDTDPAFHIQSELHITRHSLAHPLLRGAPAPDVPPISMALRFRALMMFTMMELAEGL
jgi:hypothetical protein